MLVWKHYLKNPRKYETTRMIGYSKKVVKFEIFEKCSKSVFMNGFWISKALNRSENCNKLIETLSEAVSPKI